VNEAGVSVEDTVAYVERYAKFLGRAARKSEERATPRGEE
jgi:hypothetical protein